MSRAAIAAAASWSAVGVVVMFFGVVGVGAGIIPGASKFLQIVGTVNQQKPTNGKILFPASSML